MNALCINVQKRLWTGLALVLLIPLLARAQTPQERIDAAMTRAREAGIPVSLLESKRREGEAKGVPANRIADAIQARLQHLERANQALSRAAKDVDASQLSVGADAIGAGVSEATLTEIAASTGRERRSVAVAALTYLVSQGVATNTALARVKEAAAKGSEALANLPRGSSSRVSAAETPSAAPESRGNAGRATTSGASSAIPPPGQANRPDPPGKGKAKGR